MYGVTKEEIRRLVSVIDYSEALTITATQNDVRAACEMARIYGFRAVVAFPQHLGILVDSLKDTNVRAQIPVGFPCGGVTSIEDGVALMRAGATVVAMRRYLVVQLRELESTGQ